MLIPFPGADKQFSRNFGDCSRHELKLYFSGVAARGLLILNKILCPRPGLEVYFVWTMLNFINMGYPVPLRKPNIAFLIF